MFRPHDGLANTKTLEVIGIKEGKPLGGAIDGTSINPEEVFRQVTAYNSAAVILSHNNPSGYSEPSRDDISITTHLKEALALIDVCVLDHLVVGLGEVTSFAERGML